MLKSSFPLLLNHSCGSGLGSMSSVTSTLLQLWQPELTAFQFWSRASLWIFLAFHRHPTSFLSSLPGSKSVLCLPCTLISFKTFSISNYHGFWSMKTHVVKCKIDLLCRYQFFSLRIENFVYACHLFWLKCSLITSSSSLSTLPWNSFSLYHVCRCVIAYMWYMLTCVYMCM